MKKYLIADTHFYHDKIKEYCNRPDNYNEMIINNWNSTIKDEDLIIHLGDVAFGIKKRFGDIVRSLKGTKILVKGNHDRESYAYYMRNGFSFVCDTFTYKGILFSHFPMKIELPIVHNIHGHFHNAKYEKWEGYYKNILTPQHKIFIIEEIGYRPISIDKMFKYLITTIDIIKRK